MARKSRKSIPLELPSEATCSNYRVGFYLRISDKDRANETSESIENQRDLLKDFINEKPDFNLVSEFIDDGKTGTNFRRSGFEQMMDAMKAGTINCIIVKDLSRFGRNYLEAGSYIEHVFPFLNVRFIAVTDRFDTLTATPSQLAYLIPLKNMMNENYARDISKKERSAKKALRKKGYFLAGYAIYGYEKDKYTLAIDPEAAVYVQEIFDMCEAGYSDTAIAKHLNKNKVDCPAKYKYKKGILHSEKYANSAGWYPQTIAAILTSRIYIGDMVQGKYTSKEMKGKKEVVPKENWDIVPGTHEAIISKEQFEKVERIRAARYEKYNHMCAKSLNNISCINDNSYLGGKIFCGDCKKAMTRKFIKSCNDKYRYVCEAYERNGTCTQKYLRESELLNILTELIRNRIELSHDITEWLLMPNKNDEREIEKWTQELAKIESKMNRLINVKASLYRDFKEGILDRDEYLMMKQRYEKDITQYGEEKEYLSKRKQNYIMTYTAQNPALKAASQITTDFALTKELVDLFVERVEVYEHHRIKVQLCFQDEFENVLKFWNCSKKNQERREA